MTEGESVVIQRQDEIQVYVNEAGGVTVKQIPADPCEDDPFIFFSAEDAGKVAQAILAAAKAAVEGVS